MIRRLAAHIVHQIAAGEVVERPASALKELIENALDAMPTKIIIEYEGGGLQKLVIEDDGIGMTSEDLPLAFEPHATSKLKEMDDFSKLSTFGFRGEALCSLASVSDLEIWTSTRKENVGSRGRVHFGSTDGIEPADNRVGTRVMVRNLFSRHPARLKFMKSLRSESQALSQVFRRYALAVPQVSWTFRDVSGKNEERIPAQTKFERVLWFFDSKEPSQWFTAKSENEEWKVEMIAVNSRFIGTTKAGIQLYLNGRPIKDQKLEFAVRRGFEGFTLNPKGISAAVFLEGSPELFDVNVHPMKTEVRFVNADPLFSLIVRGIRNELEKAHRDEMPAASHYVFPKFEESAFVARPAEGLQQEMNYTMKAAEVAAFAPIESPFEFLGSLDDTYIIVKKSGELYLFDQHALHERILYERLLKEFMSNSKIPSQRLLFPVPVLIQNADVLMENENVLENLGFEARLWNDGKIQIVAAPAILKRDYGSVLSKLAECISLPLETAAREVLATMACHSAVRAHDRLERAEIDRLLKDFSSEDALGHCPHGRPTFIRFQIKDLEKLFQRVV